MTLERTEQASLYTPGPYCFSRSKDGCFDTYDIITKADGRFIAGIFFWRGDDPPSILAEKEANARLLAAAPELLEALKVLLDACGHLPNAVLNPEFHEASATASFLVARTLGDLACIHHWRNGSAS